MYIPNLSTLVTSALVFSGLATKDKNTVVKGEVLDYCNKECIDDDKNMHCTKPFLIQENKCYNFEWKTKGSVVSHTTLELRKVSDTDHIQYYRDTNGEWTSDYSGLVYLDFAPKVTGCDNTVIYSVKTCK